MKLLITGGLGFIGSNMVRYLLQKYPDYRICNLDKMTYAGNPANLSDVENDPRYTFVKGDIADDTVVEKVFAEFKPDAVLNYAAESHVDRSIMDPKAFLVTEVLGTFALLEAVRRHGTKKYVQISTDEVFGSIEEGEFFEDSPMLPNSPYAAAKAGADLLCRSYVETHRSPVIVTHSCNVYGPYHYPEKVIPLFITNLLEEKKVPLYGDGKNVREWIYAKDHCSAVDFILHNAAIGEVYNIGSGERIANIDLTKKIIGLVGKGDDMIEPVKDRAGHDRRYAIDCSRLLSLGWKPQISFDEGLKHTVEWYAANEAWWKPLKSGEYQEYYEKQYITR